MISIKKNTRPPIPICQMSCDDGLDPKLNMYELTSFINTHSCICMIGAPRSGKTSLLYAFFKSPKLFKKVYNTIYVFQPSSSRASMKDSIFSQLPEDQLFEKLTYDSLKEVMDRIEASPKGESHAIIFDDQASHLKNKTTRVLFEQLVFNRRHLGVSIWFLTQGWKKIELSLRKVFSSIFLFKVGKKEFSSIWEEAIEADDNLMKPVSDLVFDQKYNFLFVDTESKTMFKNWDRILLKDDEEEKIECNSIDEK
jgi:GTPase SAR1 family protein